MTDTQRIRFLRAYSMFVHHVVNGHVSAPAILATVNRIEAGEKVAFVERITRKHDGSFSQPKHTLRSYRAIIAIGNDDTPYILHEAANGVLIMYDSKMVQIGYMHREDERYEQTIRLFETIYEPKQINQKATL